jgi:hypothetical protein
MELQQSYIETTLENWEDIFKINRLFLGSFVFRGQENPEKAEEPHWDLKTSIERKASYKLVKIRRDYGTNKEEQWMIDHFKRKLHLYSDDFRVIEDCKFSMLSKIQHYGGKTRLLDFSHSMFIAIYFAIENSFLFDKEIKMEKKKSRMEKRDCLSYSSLWCVNKYKLINRNNEKYKLFKSGVDLKDVIREKFIEFANQFIAVEFSNDITEETIKTILPLEVEYFNERISKQQGMFLMPTNSKLSFMENLWYAFNDSNFNETPFEKKSFREFLKISNKDENIKDIDVVKINIRKLHSQNIMESLIQMNITPEILFPGLNGLAKAIYHIGSDN